jgi:perosamine synthetase
MINMAKPIMEAEEKQAVLEVLDSGMLAQGDRVEEFEKAFANICSTRFAIATSNGTTALHIAILANNIKPGDEVITTPFTFIASANSILYAGATPVFVDIDPRTFNIDVDQIEAAITSKTKAILPVHLYGLCCDMDPILVLAKKLNLSVVEDACQSHGAKYKGKKTGSFGTGTFSFYPTKNITSAEGGMITTSDEAIAEHCKVIRNHGMHKRYYHDELGFNFRMTDVHAAIGLAQVQKLERFNNKRRENAAFYNANLRDVNIPYVPKDYEHVFHQYTIRVPHGKRDALREYMRAHEIGTEIYYPLPIHQQSFYVERLGSSRHFAEAEKAAAEVLSLPIHPSLTKADLETVAFVINSFMEQFA